MKKWLLRIGLVILSLLIIFEIILRVVFDLGEKPLYQSDEFCEYRLKKNQKISRFHNDYQTNSYGMRSEEVSEKDKKRILLFGDSVLNGGSKVSQEDLVTSLLRDKITDEYEEKFGVYNVSAASWGPENAYQFLINYINFDFDMIIMVFGSHDYHDNMHFRDVVGVESAWPENQTWTALGDLAQNYFSPKLSSMLGSQYDYLEGFDDSKVNPGWDDFIEYSIEHEIPLVVYHHMEVDELKNEVPNQFGLELRAMLKADSLVYIDGLIHENEENYLDNIHLNSEGHKKMATVLYNEIIKFDLSSSKR